MAIKPVLVYRNSDSTADLNSRASRIVDRGIFDGGHVSPSASAMSVDVAPFIAVGYDGIVAISDGTEILSRPAPAAGTEVSYLILHLEYRSLTSSIASLQFITESSWTSSVSKNFFVTFAKFSIGSGSTAMTDPGVTIDYSVGDWAEKAGKSGWRAPDHRRCAGIFGPRQARNHGCSHCSYRQRFPNYSADLHAWAIYSCGKR